MQGLTIYKSSAGSGKTYTLVREYLRIVLNNPVDYKHTLAITFTNKATAEMKSRIVKALAELAGEPQSVKPGYREELQKLLPRINIQSNARMALDFILHDYSRFSICTIDSFFQRVIRSLARELHISIRFDLELDQEAVVSTITENLLEESGNDKDLMHWLEELVLMKMNEDKGWRVNEDIEWVAKELFTENFPDHRAGLSRDKIRYAIKEMKQAQNAFVEEMQQIGQAAMKMINENGLLAEDFYYGNRGVYGFFNRLQSGGYDIDSYKPNSYVDKVNNGETGWAAKKSFHSTVAENVGNRLSPMLSRAVVLFETSYANLITSQEVLKHIYITGIISDLSSQLKKYRDEKNLAFISDAPKVLSTFLTSDDAAFVYEKFGTTYKHFLIDEFQDTSTLQWKNLLPLLREGLGSGHAALIVGDVKQSIYRWRGGNMQLLNNIEHDLPEYSSMIRKEKLSTNFRSRKLIVDFNNEFFTAAATLINSQLQLTDNNISTLAYDTEELKQASAAHLQEGGFVQVKFYSSDDAVAGASDILKWKQKALKNLLDSVRTLFAKGYQPKDIAILVRKNLHGNEIATYLFENGIDKVISPDSLLLESSPKINFLLSALRFLTDQSDYVAKSEVIYYYSIYQLKQQEQHELFIQQHDKRTVKNKQVKNQPALFDTTQVKDDAFNHLLPKEFTQYLFYLSKLPLYELVEQLISIFHLNNTADAYLQRFQDIVLEETNKNNFSIKLFLEWWEEHKTDFSVIVPENENAITIMTIHKSKGLQFPIVFIPWLEWTLGPDQRNLLWVTADEAPYKELGLIPVKPVRALMKSHFKQQYEEELLSNYIDNLNLMYVAMTRAEEQLYISCENNREGEIKNAADLLKRAVSGISIIKQTNPNDEATAELTFEGGEIKDATLKKQTEETAQVTDYIINRWQEKISISSKAKELQQMTDSGAKQKIDFGILVHRALAEIKSKDDIEAVTDAIFSEGIITAVEKEKLKEEINNYFSIEGINLFYDNEWKVISERRLLLPNGELLRPDRVLIKDRHAMVIDFKTGKSSPSHNKQVRQYAETLITMGYEDVQPFLIYINEKKIVSAVEQEKAFT